MGPRWEVTVGLVVGLVLIYLLLIGAAIATGAWWWPQHYLTEDEARIQMTTQQLSMLRALSIGREIISGPLPWPETTDDHERNLGSEILAAALFKDEAQAKKDLYGDYTSNTDGDTSPDSGQARFEIADAWGNPIAFIPRSRYESPIGAYRTVNRHGIPGDSSPQIRFNARTGRFYRHTSFQLVSAGLEGVFGTPDDIYD